MMEREGAAATGERGTANPNISSSNRQEGQWKTSTSNSNKKQGHRKTLISNTGSQEGHRKPFKKQGHAHEPKTP
jgi:hypothetical protein